MLHPIALHLTECKMQYMSEMCSYMAIHDPTYHFSGCKNERPMPLQWIALDYENLLFGDFDTVVYNVQLMTIIGLGKNLRW